MNTSPLPLEDRLELLAADALPLDEAGALLQDLDENGPHWKTLALLMLEERRWAPALVAENPIQNGPASETSPSLIASIQTRSKRRTIIASIAISACLLMSFLIGQRYRNDAIESIGQRPSTPMRPDQGVEPQQKKTQPAPLSPSRIIGIEDNGSKVLGIAEWESRFGRQASPLYEFRSDQTFADSETANSSADALANAGFAPSVRRELRRAGWSVEPTRTLVTIRLIGGQQLSLPMTDYQCRYVGRDVY